jgi:hypothetical protein
LNNAHPAAIAMHGLPRQTHELFVKGENDDPDE